MNGKIEKLLKAVFGDEWSQAASGTPFSELKCWDSLHYVQWVVGVQATFAIELSAKQIARLTSMAGLQEVLKEHGIQP